MFSLKNNEVTNYLRNVVCSVLTKYCGFYLLENRMRSRYQKMEDESSGQIARRAFYFPNGTGLSVIRGSGTFGYKKGLFEAAILGKDGRIDFHNPINDDVIGWATVCDVVDVADKVRELNF